MIKIIAFILCMLPVAAFANTYELRGNGSCNYGSQSFDCYGKVRFHIAPEDYGKEIAILHDETSNFMVYNGYTEIGFSPAEWADYDLPGSCTDNCAFATTDADGNLTNYWFASYNQPQEATGSWNGTGDWSVGPASYIEGRGLFGISVVPLPPAATLFAVGLAGLAITRHLRQRSHSE